MAVNNVSSSSSSIYGSRNANIVSGLASGMDTESMIENMVMGIKNKIDTQKQNQQILLWQQEAFRSISDQLVQISNKYTSYTSSTNLMSSAFFQPSIITSLGKNADMISASGSTTSDIQISKVENLAKTETVSFNGLNGAPNGNSDIIKGDKAVDLMGTEDISNLAGQQMSFKYGNKTFTITFDSDREYKTLDDVVDEINKQLGNAAITMSDGSSIKMNTKIEAQVVDAMGTDGKPTGDQTIAFTFKEGEKESNKLEIFGYSSQSVLDALNFKSGDTLSGAGVMASHSPVKTEDLKSEASVKHILAGATMNVTYNGTTATIKMPEKDSPEYDAIFKADDSASAMESYLRTQFDQAFGYNRIKVKNIASDGKFMPQFEVVSNATDGNMNTNTLTINSGTLNVIGKGGIFGIDRGASNRVNISKSIGDLLGIADGTKTINRLTDTGKTDANGNKMYALKINGVTIDDEYTVDTTLETIMNDINKNEKAGVKVSYSSTSNQFVFTSTHGGAGGKIEIGDDGANLAAKLFGAVEYDGQGNIAKVRGQEVANYQGKEFSVIQGQDAQMEAYINGVKTTLTSGTNTFDIDGFKVTANGTFTADNEGERVTFDKKVDADKIVDAVKSFVGDYNKVLAEINEQYSTQPDHDNDYKPLTDDQKADMTEKQIEEYETKAKQGLLFGDNDLGNLSNALRFVFSNSDLDAIGVSVSTSYSDKGKITLDETKLRSALASDPDAVAEAFTAPLEQKQVTNKDGSVSWVDDTSSGGAMSRLKIQLDKYAATTGATKGILIEKAGSQYSPMALLQNTLQDKIDSYDDVIDSLTEKLNDKIDFYTSKFSKLETLIAQMNSQSSYLSSLGGSSY